MKNQSGNAVVFILVGIVLFAALSVAITQSSETGKGTRDDREAQEIRGLLEYFNQVKITTQNMIYSGRCTEDEIRFWHPDRDDSADINHYGDGSNPRCQVFDATGGGVPYKTTPPALLGDAGDGEIMVIQQRISGIGVDTNDLTDDEGDGVSTDLFIGANVSRDVCLAINNQLDVENPSGEPPAIVPPDQSGRFTAPGQNFMVFPHWTTTYIPGGISIGAGGTRAPEVAGHSSACFSYEETSAASNLGYFVYTVLLAR